MEIQLHCWEDGTLRTRKLDKLDRWQVQASHKMRIKIQDIQLELEQQPQNISNKKLGVAAVCWDGAFVLADFLAGEISKETWQGASVIELGSGPGFLGVFLAKLGARVILSDQGRVLPLLETNIRINALQNRARAMELQWGKSGTSEICMKLASQNFDCIVAADCIYLDQDGQSPDTQGFVEACALLSSKHTKCYVAFEVRSEELQKLFLRSADEHFGQVLLMSHQSCSWSEAAEHIEIYLLSGKRHFENP